MIPQMVLQTILPRSTLLPYMHSFIVGLCPDVESHLPALPFPRLVIFVRGSGKVVARDGNHVPFPRAYIIGPTVRPRICIGEPGTIFVICSFRNGCFNQFFDMPLGELKQGLAPLEHFMPHWKLDSLLEKLDAARDNQQIVDMTEAFLMEANSVRWSSTRAFLPGVSIEQFFTPTANLARLVELSTRQFERRFLDNYGMPLRDYRKVVRFFFNALPLILSRPPAKGAITRIAQDCGYFDQAHFGRDFRSFVGVAPGEFIKKNSVDNPIYQICNFYGGR